MDLRIQQICHIAATLGHPFFLWRMPKQETMSCMVCFRKEPPRYPLHYLTEGQMGFVVHGADKRSHEKRAFFEADLMYRTHQKHLDFPTNKGTSSSARLYIDLMETKPMPIHPQKFIPC